MCMFVCACVSLSVQSRSETGMPYHRGDDKLAVYLVHNVEDEFVFLDVQDKLEGVYTCIGR
jgi:hypothetical protein